LDAHFVDYVLELLRFLGQSIQNILEMLRRFLIWLERRHCLDQFFHGLLEMLLLNNMLRRFLIWLERRHCLDQFFHGLLEMLLLNNTARRI
jgi:hypothetical protein